MQRIAIRRGSAAAEPAKTASADISMGESRRIRICDGDADTYIL